MGDVRYQKALERLRGAPDRAEALRQLTDDEVVQALAAFSASGERDPYLANVLATEAMNRVHRSGVLAQTAAEALVSLDPAGRVTDANPAALRALTISREAFVGRHYHPHLHLVRADGEPLPVGECPIQRVLDTQRPILAKEGRLARANGEPFDALVSVAPIQRAGEPEGAVVLFIDITERKRHEEVARQERKRLYRILDNVTEGIILMSREGRYEYVNPSAARILGAPREALTAAGAFAGRAFDLDGRPIAVRDLPSHQAMREKRRVAGRRVVIERTDGARVAIEVDALPLLGAGDELEGAVISFDDVTQRLRNEERAALLASLVDNSEDAILLETLDGVIREWNAAAERLLGYSAREMVGQHVSRVIPPERQDELDKVNARVARGERAPTFETERLAKDGARIPVSLTVSAVRDAGGRIVALSATYRDIRRLVGKRHRIRESEERYRSLFENDPSAVFSLDEEGLVTDANAPAERLVGRSIDDMRGTSFARLVDAADLERARANLARVLAGEGREDDYSMLRADGARVRVRVTGIPIRVGGRVVGVHGRARRLDDG